MVLSFNDILEQDKARLMLGEFSQSFDLVPVSGSASTIRGVMLRTFDQMPMEPGYADSNTLRTTTTEYAAPQIGDRLSDSKGVEWLVEPGSKEHQGFWAIPVKADRRLRS